MKKGFFTLRRLLVVAVVVIILAAVWSAWLAWRTERELRSAEDAVNRLQAAVENGDDSARDTAVADLQASASSAKGYTDGLWWSAMTKLPVYGDDASGVEALSASIDLVAREAIGPLAATVDALDGLVEDGQIDPAKVAELEGPISGAARAMRHASGLVSAHDPKDFMPALSTRYADYAKRLAGIASDFSAAETAVDVLPNMLGGDGPRNYLFIFQNNAEIRSTGGLPGSWARVHVENGKIQLREQGSAAELNNNQSAAELTDEELAVYDQLPALFFQDPNFIPDFPRAATLFNAFWSRTYPAVELDGILTLDPVAMSYLMAGTGPVQAGELTLTAENIVPELLSNTYLSITDPSKQDEQFQEVARAILSASTSRLASPIDFVQGLSRAVRERRFLLAPTDPAEVERLNGASILGQLTGDDGAVPHVDIGLNDATGSKMSYYLRYFAGVESRSCLSGVQALEGTMTLNQTISPRDARALPDYVTGGDAYGIPIGSQLVTARIYGPYGGSISDVRLNGEPLDPKYGLQIDGRPVVTISILIDTIDDARVTWKMQTAVKQTGSGKVGLTPSVLGGTLDSQFKSAC